jgi:hypothetical protein
MSRVPRARNELVWVPCLILLWLGCDAADSPQPSGGGEPSAPNEAPNVATGFVADGSAVGRPASLPNSPNSPNSPNLPNPPDPASTPGPQRHWPQPSTLHPAHEVTVPTVSEPQHVGPLIGPGARVAPNRVQFYGTDLGITFEHQNQHFILFGDTWSNSGTVCDQVKSTNDDTFGTLPLRYSGGVPLVTFATQANDATRTQNLRVYRGTQSLRLGLGQAPLSGFSDGQSPYIVFERLEPVPCSPEQVSAHTGCLAGNPTSFCSSELGTCTPSDMFPMMCDAVRHVGCPPNQTCQAQSFCIDRTSSQFDDGHLSAQAASVAYYTEIAAARSGAPGVFDSVHTWLTNKFSHPAAKTVRTFTGTSTGNDYRPGTDTLLFWGRPGFIAEEGRQAQLYLMAHRLPLAVQDGKLKFEPQFFAGVDPLTAEPRWSPSELNAKAIALDGIVDGSPSELVPIVGMYSISYLPAPVDKWVMMYGGDFADYLMSDTVGSRLAGAAGAIMLRFADHPWGPFSPPQPHLLPGSPTKTGDPYGPGGILYHPDCTSTQDAACAQSDPRRPIDSVVAGCPETLPDPGRLYAPYPIDSYITPNPAGGLDVVWNVSTWNPYGVQLMRTTFAGPATPPPADELSDAATLEHMSDWRALPQLEQHPARYATQTSADRSAAIAPVRNGLLRAANVNNFVCKSPDAKITVSANASAPLRFDMPTCAESYVHGVVLSRFEGAGRMLRTTLGTNSLLRAGAAREQLRVYVDDEPTPRVDVPLAAALDGSAGEVFAPPFGAGSPVRLAWHYPISFNSKLIVSLDQLSEAAEYTYQSEVVFRDTRDPLAAPAATSRTRLGQRDAVTRQLTNRFHPSGDAIPLRDAEQVQLAADESKAFTLVGPWTIEELRVRVRESELAQLKNVTISVRWDGATEPAIALPLSDLFASSDAAPDYSSLALTSFADLDDHVLALKLPMPFLWRASFTLHNTGNTSANFELRWLGALRQPGTELGYLHTQHNVTRTTLATAQHVALQTAGPGRMVGLCTHMQDYTTSKGSNQSAFGPSQDNQRAMLDGQLSLDAGEPKRYADDVFQLASAPYTTPFAQAWGVVTDTASANGSADLCRWHVLGNELDFQTALKLVLQLGSAKNSNVLSQLRTVAYYYSLAP